jgi:hypothetical protein
MHNAHVFNSYYIVQSNDLIRHVGLELLALSIFQRWTTHGQFLQLLKVHLPYIGRLCIILEAVPTVQEIKKLLESPDEATKISTMKTILKMMLNGLSY